MNNSGMIFNLRDMRVAQDPEKNAVSGTSLAGQTCIMTGTFDWLDREDFKGRVCALGGKICSSITKNTTIVLVGDNAGPKKVSAIAGMKSAGHDIKVLGPGDRKEIEKLLEISDATK
jgi:BRCT domain type II-containing protein